MPEQLVFPVTLLISLAIVMYPVYAPMPEWRKRQLERKKPMRGRTIDI